MHPLGDLLDHLGLVHPLSYGAAVVAASWLVLWRVEACLDRGLEGTALGTLLLPYCSGLGNLLFVFLMLRGDAAPAEVVVNAVVNNVTNLTLLLGLPALLWGLVVVPGAAAGPRRRKAAGSRRQGRGGAQLEQRLSRLSVLLTLGAVGFFTATVWWLSRDGSLAGADGAVLIGIFLFWQSFQVYDTLKHNLQRNLTLGPRFVLDAVLVLAAAWMLYESLEWIVQWLSSSSHGFFRAENLGWITGWLLVLPNALVALFYAARGRADIVYTSQIGDGHICIPLCLGLAAAVRPVPVPPMLELGVMLLLGAATLHALALLLWGRLPRPLAGVLVIAYGGFLYAGLLD